MINANVSVLAIATIVMASAYRIILTVPVNDFFKGPNWKRQEFAAIYIMNTNSIQMRNKVNYILVECIKS